MDSLFISLVAIVKLLHSSYLFYFSFSCMGAMCGNVLFIYYNLESSKFMFHFRRQWVREEDLAKDLKLHSKQLRRTLRFFEEEKLVTRDHRKEVCFEGSVIRPKSFCSLLIFYWMLVWFLFLFMSILNYLPVFANPIRVSLV